MKSPVPSPAVPAHVAAVLAALLALGCGGDGGAGEAPDPDAGAVAIDAGEAPDATAPTDGGGTDAAGDDGGPDDASAPVLAIRLLAPDDGAVVGDGPLSIEAEVTGAVDRVEILVDGDVIATPDAPYTHAWQTDAVAEGTYRISARAWAGELEVTSDGVDVRVDHTPPSLVASTPDDAASNVDVNGDVVLDFDEAVLAPEGSVTARSLVRGTALPLTLSSSADGTQLTADLSALEVPEQVEVTLTADITDLAGNPLSATTLSFEVPVWLGLGPALIRNADADASELHLAHGPDGEVFALWAEDGSLFASMRDGLGWSALGGAIDAGQSLASPTDERRAALAIDADGMPLVAWRDASGARVSRWDGTGWVALGSGLDPLGGGSHAPAITVDGAGDPVVGFDEVAAGPTPRLRLRRFDGAAWQDQGSPLAVESSTLRLRSSRDGTPVLAYRELSPAPGFQVARWDGAAFTPLGAAPALPASTGLFDAAAGAGDDVVITARAAGAARFGSGAWQAVGRGLGFLVSASAERRALLLDTADRPVVAFTETPPATPTQHVYVQRRENGYWQPLGPALNAGADGSSPALAESAGGGLTAGFLLEQAGGERHPVVVRFNSADGSAPRGIRRREATTACLATPPADGSDLLDSGCMADAGARIPIAGFIPFDVRSPLWTDGAAKRRFLLLPEASSTLEYRDPGIWTLPVGSIIYKEFSIEGRAGDPATLRPVETRFLVVRDDGPWERYSYQWNQDATSAVLREATPALDRAAFDILDEAGDPALQIHFYPSRGACLQCHETPGTVLGLQTVQFNRNLDYGTTIDNQLRALSAAGVFDAGFDGAIADAGWMPNAGDAAHPTEARLRAYLHANCSSCHHPLFGLDLRHEVPTVDVAGDSGLCTKITKGDLDGSRIYWRDVLRRAPEQPANNAPMPPLGTLVENPLIEVLLTDWILDPENPCP